MQEPAQQDLSAFQTLLTDHYAQIAHSDDLQKIRAKAWEHFLALGLPTRQSEVFNYIKLRNLFAQTFAPSQAREITLQQISSSIFPECKQSVLVFVNGHYHPNLSNTTAIPSRVVISTLTAATRTYGAFLNNHWTKSFKEELDPFAMLNIALHRDGIFLYLPPKSVVEVPIQILHVIDTAETAMMLMPRMQIFVGAHSQLTTLSSIALISGSNYCINQITDFTVEENSHVSHTQIACNENPAGWHFDAIRATVKRNSSFKTVNITNGCMAMRNDYRVTLTGENSEASLNGMWMLSDQREAHTHILIEHQAPNCRSNQLFKGALNDHSRSSFEGKILVRQAAQKTDAFQLNNNLLLSDRAQADSKPNLEIYADDVKASHGATVGQLDQEQLFYMKARGFSEETAKNMLVYSFCKEVIDLITLPSLHHLMTEQAKQHL